MKMKMSRIELQWALFAVGYFACSAGMALNVYQAFLGAFGRAAFEIGLIACFVGALSTSTTSRSRPLLSALATALFGLGGAMLVRVILLG